jgi:hypothetical protein
MCIIARRVVLKFVVAEQGVDLPKDRCAERVLSDAVWSWHLAKLENNLERAALEVRFVAIHILIWTVFYGWWRENLVRVEIFVCLGIVVEAPKGVSVAPFAHWNLEHITLFVLRGATYHTLRSM